MALWDAMKTAIQWWTTALLRPVMFPWLNDRQASRIFDQTKDEDEKTKAQKQYEIYKQVLPITIANKKLEERVISKKEIMYQSTQEKDVEKKKQMDLTLKMADYADDLRRYAMENGKDATDIPDNDLIGQVIKTIPNGDQLFADYINGTSDEIYTASGLREAPVVLENKHAQGLLDFLWGKTISTEREVSQFLDPLWNKWTGGANPWTALNIVGKSLLNLVPNAVAFVKWVGSMIFHPKQTVEWLKSMWQGIIDQSQWDTTTPQAQMVSWIWWEIKKTVTDPQKLWQFIFENPLDILTVVSPKWTLELANVATKWAIKGTIKWAEVLGKWTARASEFVASQAFGITPQTIKTIIRNPELYTQVEKWVLNSEEMLGSLGTKIDEKIAKIWETGKWYQTIKETANIQSPVDEINGILKSRGIEIKDWKLDFTNTNMADTSDMNAIQKAYDFVNSDNVNVLNTRGKLDDLINYESKTTSKWQSVVKEIRKAIDTKAKNEIPWLAKLDATYWMEVKELKNIKKDFLNADGTFKDNALSRISNLTKKGNEAKLERVKNLLPWIENNINAIRAFEDVALAGWQKVGAYLRWAGTVWIWALAGWPVWAIVWLLLTSPQVATNLLKWLWYAKEFIAKIVSKLKTGTKITSQEMWILSSKLENGTITTNTIGNTNVIDSKLLQWLTTKVEKKWLPVKK